MHTPQVQSKIKASTAARQSCIGCADCKGLCADLLDLVCVPDSVLHRSVATP